MTFYSRMQKTANKLLLGKGQTVTITHVVPGTYDPETGLVTNTTTTQTGTGAVMDWDARQVDGTLIKIGDKRLLLSPLNTAGAVLTAPVLGDTVTDAADVVYTLVAPLKTISPAGTAVLYDCNMRV
uniref:Putative structural protein n=1 Tax=viral metagenome TaxID=1070528 RepID=A0A6M3LF83_9ZZZZ